MDHFLQADSHAFLYILSGKRQLHASQYQCPDCETELLPDRRPLTIECLYTSIVSTDTREWQST
jgi:hypothetical protein